ncbi:fibrous sheath CABYR-binding protein-like X4 [Biomphalaria pfeifferi]|uniref:Fibrous sheath CABYR-binding protein-like X4 n=1 Tax=Biomphalaria pfeifferi TaxID=112525 RepID=A0AAD8CC51_BIOPF|nr:fibrous sheath CABYR-binding protein-like X4 [Biomphalaria pfeifferi]
MGCVGSKKKKGAEQPASPKAEEPENPPAEAGEEAKGNEEGGENPDAEASKDE